MAQIFKLSNTKPKSVPMSTSDVFCLASEREIQESRSLPYREIMGCLNYLCVVSRPDISFAVSKLSRYLSAYSRHHWNAAKNILKYLITTKDLSLTYSANDGDIQGFTDADWGGDLETRKSTSGYIFLFGSTAVTWKTKLQSIVAASTLEAEYIAQAFCVREAIWLRKLIKDFGLKQKCIPIKADNQGSIGLSKDSKITPRTKHIDVSYHLVVDYQEKNYVHIIYTPTDQMLADMLTKPLLRVKFERNVKAIGFQTVS